MEIRCRTINLALGGSCARGAKISSAPYFLVLQYKFKIISVLIITCIHFLIFSFIAYNFYILFFFFFGNYFWGNTNYENLNLSLSFSKKGARFVMARYWAFQRLNLGHRNALYADSSHKTPFSFTDSRIQHINKYKTISYTCFINQTRHPSECQMTKTECLGPVNSV